MTILFSLFLASTPIISSGERFTCTPVRVWDGDGPIWCAEGPRIRFSGIAAREIDGKCNRGHPCPKASGTAARDYLAGIIGKRIGTSREGHILIRGQALQCVSVGGAGGNRTAAWCRGAIGDLSCAMVRSGYALKWDKYWSGHKCSKRRKPL